jgi:hypothetical protein
LNINYDKKGDNVLRKAIQSKLYDGCVSLINWSGSSMGPQTVRLVLDGALPAHRLLQAMNYGDRTASFPLTFCWSLFDTYQRKYITYCVMDAASRPRAPLYFFPCPLARLLDYMDWLPSHGCPGTAWSSIRHYVRSVRRWSHRLGWGDPKDEDKQYYDSVKLNFVANREVVKSARGGQEVIRPHHLRAIAMLLDPYSPDGAFWLCLLSMVWFTAVRFGNLVPKSNHPKHRRNLICWADCYPCWDEPTPTLVIDLKATKTRRDNHRDNIPIGAICICQINASASPVCPVHAYLRWQATAPNTEHARQPVFQFSDRGQVLQGAISRRLSQITQRALHFIPEPTRSDIVARVSMKSLRSGPATALVEDDNIGEIALSAFMDHRNLETTQRFYVHLPALAKAAATGPALAKQL